MQKNNYLKRIRNKKGLSQEELAKRLNVTRSLVSSWENGSPINNEYQELLAKELNINLKLIKYNGNTKLLFLNDFKSVFKKLIVFIFIILIISFLLFSFKCIYYYFKNKDYLVRYFQIIPMDENKILTLNNSYFFVSNEMGVIVLTPEYKIDMEKIESINLFYYENDKKNYIFQSDRLDNLYYECTISERSSFDLDKTDYIISNMSLEIKLKDGWTEYVALSFLPVYSSAKKDEYPDNRDKIKEEDKKRKEEEKKKEDIPYKGSSILGKVEKIHTIINENNDAISFTYQDKKVILYDNEESVSLDITDKNSHYELNYTKAEGVNAEHLSRFDYKEQKVLYYFNIAINDCLNINDKIDYCQLKDEDRKLYEEILDYLIKKYKL